MDMITLVACVSIFTAGITTAFGAIGPAFGEARGLDSALKAIAQQPDESNTLMRTLFVGMAMIESTAIYCFVVSMILIFANPFWDQATGKKGHGQAQQTQGTPQNAPQNTQQNTQGTQGGGQ